MTARWGMPDPPEVSGFKAEVAVASLDRMSLKPRMDEIGRGADTLAGAATP